MSRGRPLPRPAVAQLAAFDFPSATSDADVSSDESTDELDGVVFHSQREPPSAKRCASRISQVASAKGSSEARVLELEATVGMMRKKLEEQAEAIAEQRRLLSSIIGGAPAGA